MIFTGKATIRFVNGEEMRATIASYEVVLTSNGTETLLKCLPTSRYATPPMGTVAWVNWRNVLYIVQEEER